MGQGNRKEETRELGNEGKSDWAMEGRKERREEGGRQGRNRNGKEQGRRKQIRGKGRRSKEQRWEGAKQETTRPCWSN